MGYNTFEMDGVSLSIGQQAATLVTHNHVRQPSLFSGLNFSLERKWTFRNIYIGIFLDRDIDCRIPLEFYKEIQDTTIRLLVKKGRTTRDMFNVIFSFSGF
ncbi:hypothetical protein FRX31_030544 [Thalictrum thalictroides]|uniref:Uncharacterized protein n=1 Tax=Thalictrum thalictroides TaxID=46969 RepID=A0A7J6V4Y5_THATH|nr:hypothetical protein FRX31_030544 [Thalictrum thalictroides]